MAEPMEGYALILEKKCAYNMRKKLESLEATNKRWKILHCQDQETVAIPVSPSAVELLKNIAEPTGPTSSPPSPSWSLDGMTFTLDEVTRSTTSSMPGVKSRHQSPWSRLLTALRTLVEQSGASWSSELEADVPQSWEKHGDLVLLPSTGFQLAVWKELDARELWTTVCQALGCKRLARKSTVCSDDYRTPQVELLLEESGWVLHNDNGIKYAYDVTQCMFSAGNISEKLRIASWDCSGLTVVDMYAGIGYFTLPYLVHANAERLYACEWNPASVLALRKGLELNGVAGRCVVLHGDNRQVCPKGVADHVNLGLIPSSELSWPAACAALKPTSGGILHIHGNVTCYAPRNTNGYPRKVSENMLGDTGLGERLVGWTAIFGTCTDPTHSVETGDELNCNYERGSIYCKLNDPSEGSFYRVNSKSRESLVMKRKPEMTTQEGKHAKKCAKKLKPEWKAWGAKVAAKIGEILQELHKKEWQITVVEIVRVKSYAPRVDHMVVDLQCSPKDISAR